MKINDAPIEIDATIITRPIETTALTFADNPQPRCPVVLLLDCSSSMVGQPSAMLREAVAQFYAEIASDPIASMSVEICVIALGSNAWVLRGFEPAADAKPPSLPEDCGTTPIGKGIHLGLHEIAERRSYYGRCGTSAYKPWMILMTDGQPTDEWQHAAAQAATLSNKNQLFFMGVGIGAEVDMGTLGKIVPPAPGAHKLKGLHFREFFRWLSDSLRVVSSGSTTVTKQVLPDPDEYDWRV